MSCFYLSFSIPAILSNVDNKEILNLKKELEEISLIYQIIDDYEDFEKKEVVNFFKLTDNLYEYLDDKDKINGAFFGFKSNQLRFYNQEGEYIGSTKKTKLVSFDCDCVKETKAPVITLTKGEAKLKVGALICNDLVGNYYWGGDNLASKLKDEQVALIIHASNTQKDQGPHIKLLHDNFHDACTQFISYATNIPILSVDNPWHLHGVESKDGTSFTSGIYLPLEAKYQAPKTGTQYFYYDHSDITYSFSEGTDK